MKALIMLLLTLPTTVWAELVIVAGGNSDINPLSEAEVRQLFSGHLKVVAGQRVQALDLPGHTQSREEFYRKLMGRTPEQMRAYWTRLIFTGQGKPPREVSNTQELITLVNSGEYIGYLPAEEVGTDLRILYRLK